MEIRIKELYWYDIFQYRGKKYIVKPFQQCIEKILAIAQIGGKVREFDIDEIVIIK